MKFILVLCTLAMLLALVSADYQRSRKPVPVNGAPNNERFARLIEILEELQKRDETTPADGTVAQNNSTQDDWSNNATYGNWSNNATYGNWSSNATDGNWANNSTGAENILAKPFIMAFAALSAKCDTFYYYVKQSMGYNQGVTNLDYLRSDDEDDDEDTPLLSFVCPVVRNMSKQIMENGEDLLRVAKNLTELLPLFQCSNLMAEVEVLHMLGFNENEDAYDGMTSGILIHGKPLFEECEEMFGDAMEEGSKIKVFIEKFLTTKRCDKPESKSLRELLQRFHISLPIPKRNEAKRYPVPY